jgi:DNA-binding NtrC family response regulator
MRRCSQGVHRIALELARRAATVKAVQLIARLVARRAGRAPVRLDLLAVRMLFQHNWPENIRELDQLLGAAIADVTAQPGKDPDEASLPQNWAAAIHSEGRSATTRAGRHVNSASVAMDHRRCSTKLVVRLSRVRRPA